MIDEFFFTASNRLSKICAPSPELSKNQNETQASKLIGHKGSLQAPGTIKLENFKKNQTGRPYSAPTGGLRRLVLLPFLIEEC